MRALRSLALVAVLSASAPARARSHDLQILAGGEVWPKLGESGLGGHGFALLRYQLGGLPRGAHFELYFNSDTLRLAYGGIQLAGGRIEIGFDATGEVLLAGLLPDYYRDGRADPGRGFYASYAMASGYAKLLRAPHYVELAAGARKWFFARQSVTSPALVLPSETWVGEVRLRYTFWRIEPDPSLWQAHRLYPRVVGFAFGVEAGFDARSDARPWGAADASAFVPVDLRNRPDSAIFQVKQWARAGLRLGSRVRLQLAEAALVMWGEDDLVRARVGGLNPYVIPLAGAPWAALLAGRVASVEASVHVRFWRELEVGALADAVAVDDARRFPPARPALIAGLGVFADLRYRAWQADVRGGYCPNLPGAGAAFSFLAAAGWSWSR